MQAASLTPKKPLPLGEMLCKHGDIDTQHLQQLLQQQQRSGGWLGELATAAQLVPPLRLYQLLSEQQQTPLIDLTRYPCENSLLQYDKVSDYLRRGYIPWRMHEGKLWIACTDISIISQLQQEHREPLQLVLCTPRDIRSAIEQRFGKRMEHQARTRIVRELHDYSASYTTNAQQQRIISTLFGILLAFFLAWPQSMAIGALILINLIYFINIGFKYILYIKADTPAEDKSWQQLDERSLPMYSILIPMYREAESVPRLLGAIRALDYPRHKLDVKLVIEADDIATYRAIQRAQPEPFFDIIRVPRSQPRTKPKACSYALNFARGDFVTIYDAEDQPEPAQLKKAVAAFRQAPDSVICLQARLNYYNWNENLLTRCFAIEYASLFDRMLPALQRLAIPIPLGGTSNHIHLKKLRELKDWDPYNVTEDADLGIRLALAGYETRMLDSITLEEAPIRLVPWLKQRSRWIKGYMQTWLVYMRHPALMRSRLGSGGFWGFHLMVGSPCLVFLVAPFLWVFSLLWLAGFFHIPVAGWLMLLSYSVFSAGYCCHFQYAEDSIRRWRWHGMFGVAWLYPFYWLLHSIASVRALRQLIFRPHYWEKTQHSQTRYNMYDIAIATNQLAGKAKTAVDSNASSR